MLLLSRNMCQCDIYIERESVQVGFCWGSCWVASDRSSTIDMKSLLCVILLLRQLTIRNGVWFSWMVAENSRMTLVNIKYHIFFTNTGVFFLFGSSPWKWFVFVKFDVSEKGEPERAAGAGAVSILQKINIQTISKIHNRYVSKNPIFSHDTNTLFVINTM